MRKTVIENFLTEYEFSTKAIYSLLYDYQKISQNKKANELFESVVVMYEKDQLVDYDIPINAMKEIASTVDVSVYACYFLFYLCLTPHLKELYIQKGISLEIYHSSMLDFKYKLDECYNLHGVYGTEVPGWYQFFFLLRLFCIGRLEFMKVPFKCPDGKPFTYKGITVNVGDDVIDVHIPSSGPLRMEDCLASYKKAYEFYPECIKDGILVFRCHSWMLYPENQKILSSNSNVVKFASDFRIYSVDQNEEFPFWRIYYKDADLDPKDWPENTSMQRGFKHHVLNGGEVGSGAGLLFFDGEKVL